jgi:biotin operon repressor
MIPDNSTPVPNTVFDYYISILKPTELTLLLVVIRQTTGWYDPYTRKRKERDWLSGSQLRQKTGYSRKAISTATSALIKHQLLRVYHRNGFELATPEERQGKMQLYYGFHIPGDIPVENRLACVESTQHMSKKYVQQKKLLQKKMIISN